MEKNHYDVMRRIILACMIGLPVLPFILALVIGYSYFTASIEDSTISSMKRIVGSHRHMIESFLRERRANLEFIHHSYTSEELSQPQKLHHIFNLLQKESNAFVDIGIFNEEGVHVAYHGPYKLTGKVYKEADWFTEVIKKGYYISDVFLGFRKVPHFIIAVAREEQGRKWVVRSTIDTYMFNNMVKKVRIGQTGEAYLLNAEGVFQTERRSGSSLMAKDSDYKKYHHAFNGTSSRDKVINSNESSPDASIRTFIETDAKGNEYLYATTWMKNKKWLLVVRQEKADAFNALSSAVSLIVLITICGGIIIVAVAFYLTDKIIDRMKKTDAEKSQLEDQLIRAHRLAELGQMSAGFAHEINNPLQIIKSEHSLIEMLLSDMKEEDHLKESESLTELNDSMDQIKLQIERCAKITQAILKFGRQNEVTIQEVDLRSFIPEITSMIAKKASVHGIDLKQDIAKDTPEIQGDPGQLQQVLLNLYNNALDAIVERHGAKHGKMIIKAEGNKNGKVEISVTDNGIGIDPEHQKNIFSPFFTTKTVGKGTGLGLSVCYGIIDNMGGTMKVSSQKDVGTTFTVSLPVG
ncbi:sensor histidine kinase [Desulfonema magnum]|uniref:histidine kinase n=1 Tax=Desulfonema magnum TaxID=45655 RepID=A0A975GQ10_9BACT|nr:sensor histidine kinase [Desulfonema magnum]QTA89561.1 Two component system histidine kinase, double Cache domain-containing [Desulfonema magnum]